MTVRTVGVDWSGAVDPAVQRRCIWVAAVEDGEVVEVSAGRTREETVEHLAELARGSGRTARPVPTLAGLDFSFGFPAWFAREHGARSGPEVWELAAARGGSWLRDCPPPFFGLRGRRRPAGVELFRATERRVAAAARVHPKSIFQLAGPGTVGPGSLRGMPLLTRLRDAGFAVWPFDPCGVWTVAEVYPALAVGRPDLAAAVTPEGRRRVVEARCPGTSRRFPAVVEHRDAFDAVAAALLLARTPGRPAPPRERAAGLEGEIWASPARSGNGFEGHVPAP
ncbi:MAG TPA: hypothetical protein VFC99_02740 [Acidimicrobiia bacterium]|nr:hypothetical protein [Acidimicrobiia bacterium]